MVWCSLLVDRVGLVPRPAPQRHGAADKDPTPFQGNPDSDLHQYERSIWTFALHALGGWIVLFMGIESMLHTAFKGRCVFLVKIFPSGR